jgi:hypothetical protein
MSAVDAYQRAGMAFARVGKIKGQQDAFLRITGRVMSGAMNMNRADVTILVTPTAESTATLIFDATAQEGLIPQGTAAKAISRILEAF